MNVWSTTKTVTSLAALMLVDRGELDVDVPVATYWPEFAANGKQDVLVRNLMGHTSGVSGVARRRSGRDPVAAAGDDRHDLPRAVPRVGRRARRPASLWHGVWAAGICFWGGWGGSVILMDVGRRMTIAYMMNKMGAGIIGSDRAEQYGRTIYAALGS